MKVKPLKAEDNLCVNCGECDNWIECDNNGKTRELQCEFCGHKIEVLCNETRNI